LRRDGWIFERIEDMEVFDLGPVQGIYIEMATCSLLFTIKEMQHVSGFDDSYINEGWSVLWISMAALCLIKVPLGGKYSKLGGGFCMFGSCRRTIRQGWMFGRCLSKNFRTDALLMCILSVLI
jgi:hypothetical protein